MRMFEPAMGMGFVELNGKTYIIMSKRIRKNQWNHFCFTLTRISPNNNTLLLVLNGELLFDDLTNLPDLQMTTQDMKDNGLSIGMYKEGNGTFYHLYHGFISELYMWSKSLPLDFMIRATNSCSDVQTSSEIAKPDLFNYYNINWTQHQKSHLEVLTATHRNDFCSSPTDKVPWLIPVKRNMNISSHICQGMGGHMWYPESKEDINNVLAVMEQKYKDVFEQQCIKKLWLGIYKVGAGPKMVDMEGKEVTYFNWKAGQPNGRHFEPCVRLDGTFTIHNLGIFFIRVR